MQFHDRGDHTQTQAQAFDKANVFHFAIAIDRDDPNLLTDAGNCYWQTGNAVQALEADIRSWIKSWNENPKPFVWKKSAEEILDSLARYLQRISGARH